MKENKIRATIVIIVLAIIIVSFAILEPKDETIVDFFVSYIDAYNNGDINRISNMDSRISSYSEALRSDFVNEINSRYNYRLIGLKVDKNTISEASGLVAYSYVSLNQDVMTDVFSFKISKPDLHLLSLNKYNFGDKSSIIKTISDNSIKTYGTDDLTKLLGDSNLTDDIETFYLTFKNNNDKYSIQYPSHWDVSKDVASNRISFISKKESEDDIFRENLNIATINSSDDLNIFIENIKKDSLDVNYYELLSEEKLQISGHDSYKLVYKLDRPDEGERLVEQVATKFENKVYLLTYTILNYESDIYINEISNMIESFKIGEFGN